MRPSTGGTLVVLWGRLLGERGEEEEIYICWGLPRVAGMQGWCNGQDNCHDVHGTRKEIASSL
jgi:hypothetical protein